MNTEIVVADIGGTHARFALAQLATGQVASMSAPLVLKTAEYSSLASAWSAFAHTCGRPLPRHAAIAVAAPVTGNALQLTNNRWIIDPATLTQLLDLDTCRLINDFGAVSHAVTQLDSRDLHRICGPDQPLPTHGVISVVGPGTGLGVAQVVRGDAGDRVIESEGGHIGFAPCDAVDGAILQALRTQHGRVSAERVISGPGLMAIYRVLATQAGEPPDIGLDERGLWQAALSGDQLLAKAALERFCRCLGSFAGDIALAQGAAAVVIAGGLGRRLAHALPPSGFAACFVDKGRMSALLERIPVWLIDHPEPGLFGAAIAFARADAQQDCT